VSASKYSSTFRRTAVPTS